MMTLMFASDGKVIWEKIGGSNIIETYVCYVSVMLLPQKKKDPKENFEILNIENKLKETQLNKK